MVKGTKHSEESKKKQSESHKGITPTPKQLESLKMGHGWNKGLKGKLSHNFGKHYNTGIKSWNKGKKFPQYSNENHPNWKGDDVGYGGLHRWIERKLGKPKECVHCGRTNCVLDWANVDHKYKRNTEDWLRLCRRCHRKHDYLIVSV